eukprot:COSAG01_NODE_7825_length_3040_cov_10.843251_1_plen_191_part_00
MYLCGFHSVYCLPVAWRWRRRRRPARGGIDRAPRRRTHTSRKNKSTRVPGGSNSTVTDPYLYSSTQALARRGALRMDAIYAGRRRVCSRRPRRRVRGECRAGGGCWARRVRAGGEAVAHLVEVRGQIPEDSGHRAGARKSLRVPADRRGVSAAADRGVSLCTWGCPSAPPSAPAGACLLRWYAVLRQYCS